MDLLFHCSIPGRCYIKKNTKRVFGRGRKKRVIYSPNYMGWEELALAYITRAKLRLGLVKPIEEKVTLKCCFYFKDRQAEPDLSNIIESPQDALVKAKVLKDDKLIYSLDGSRKYFGFEPHMDLYVYRYVEGDL